MENLDTSQNQNISPSQGNRVKRTILIFLVGFFVLFLIFDLFVGSIKKFDTPKHIEIKRGDSLRTVTLKLEEAGVIDSSTLLSTTVILLGGESHIVSGLYSFPRREGIFFVAKRISEGKTNIKSTKITFPEGYNVAQIGKRLKEVFPNFNEEEFVNLAQEKEGFLFPDTYFFLPNVTPLEVLERLEGTFWEKVEENFSWIKEQKEKFINSLILASIVEEEVKSFEDKRIVAGIFLNRIKIGMPLQADSTLAYVTGRDSLSLTVEDLKSTSLYNTYTNKGLPPTPISNPGLESIEAVLNPTSNKYFYFLTDKEGKVYYAKTFEEHKQNKIKYLK